MGGLRRKRTLSGLSALSGLVLAGSLLGATGARAGSVVVRAEGIESAQGLVVVGICDKAFDVSACPYRNRRAARPGLVEVAFEDVRPGVYAVVIYHDLNGNGQLDRNLIGIPSEPYGFSNGVGRTSRPTLATAGVRIGEGVTRVAVRVRRALSGS